MTVWQRLRLRLPCSVFGHYWSPWMVYWQHDLTTHEMERGLVKACICHGCDEALFKNVSWEYTSTHTMASDDPRWGDGERP